MKYYSFTYVLKFEWTTHVKNIGNKNNDKFNKGDSGHPRGSLTKSLGNLN